MNGELAEIKAILAELAAQQERMGAQQERMGTQQERMTAQQERTEAHQERTAAYLTEMAARQAYHDEAFERMDTAIKKLITAAEMDGENIRRLANIAQAHERRLDRIEGRPDEET